MTAASCVWSGAPLNLIPCRLAAADIATAAVCASGLEASEQEDAAPMASAQTRSDAFLPNDGCGRPRPGRGFTDARNRAPRGKGPATVRDFRLSAAPSKTDAWHAGRAIDTLKAARRAPRHAAMQKIGNKVSAGPDIRFQDIAYRARDDLLYLHMLVKAITQSPQTSTRNAKDGPYHSTRFETEKV